MLNFRLIMCLGAALTTTAALAQGQSQAISDSQVTKIGSPVAYIYVSSTPGNGNPNSIVGYSAASKWRLNAHPRLAFFRQRLLHGCKRKVSDGLIQ
jgi:hypothetical protein